MLKREISKCQRGIKDTSSKGTFLFHIMRKIRRELERESDSNLFCILSPGHLVLYHLSYHKCYETHLLGNNGLNQSTHSATKMLRFQEVEPANTQGCPAEGRVRRKRENNRKPKAFRQRNRFQLQFYDR